MAMLFPKFTSCLSPEVRAAGVKEGTAKLNSVPFMEGYQTYRDAGEKASRLVTRVPGAIQVWFLAIYLIGLTALVLGGLSLVDAWPFVAGVFAVHWAVIVGMGYAQHKYYKRLEEADR
ncbi:MULTISPECIES: hypothetical protein [Hyphomonas]|uniref:hypothetical protein n=1 Tax=Hyphomonas TaxID=85 RepID=UPI002353EF10|nr:MULTISPECIES: hypothetical protein [Hyphomonas]